MAPDASKKLQAMLDFIVSPREKSQLERISLGVIAQQARRKIKTKGLDCGNYGMGDGSFLLRDASGNLYPVIDEFPVLLYPEQLVDVDDQRVVDLLLPQYHEAYSEMSYYNATQRHEENGELSTEVMRRHMAGVSADMENSGEFPDPMTVWVDALHDTLSQYDAYKYIAPVRDKSFLQLGGMGTHAVKALLAGAKVAYLLTPMLGEARLAKQLAIQMGVADKFFCVIAVGEECPFAVDSFDCVYSGGCLHHMRTDAAFSEIKRLLRTGGRFSAVDPWKTTLHQLGTKILGKRETSVFCKPLDAERLKPLSVFSKHAVLKHGPLLRYVFLGMEKMGLKLSIGAMARIGALDDQLGKLFHLTSASGSIVVCAEK